MKKRQKKPMKIRVIIIILATITLASCTNDPIPKPRGYFRIDHPEKGYEEYQSNCDFRFERPKYSYIEKSRSAKGDDSCWFNLVVPSIHAKIHFTYLPVRNNLADYMDDAYNFAYQHNIKASGIKRTMIHNDSANVHGIVYDLKGNVASPLQFYVTDSTDHFLRGALYFSRVPNADSLSPSLDFIREDMIHLMNTTRWE
jgi:gliding motility-associated lipoprotein GldD